MQLQLSTWVETEAYLKEQSGIILPIGSTEQHGPNGLIGTDSICPEVIACGVGETTGAMVAPTINFGMAQHHLGFPGTVTLRPATLIAVIRDIVHSLRRHGFERFYFLNGHGGNMSTVTAAFNEVYTDFSLADGDDAGGNRAAPRCRLTNWWMGPSVRALSRELFGAAEGSHATPSEVSLTYYVYPEARKSVELSPKIAPTGPIRDADDYRRRFPDGRIGSDPSLASVEAGEKLYHAAVKDVSVDYLSFVRD